MSSWKGMWGGGLYEGKLHEHRLLFQGKLNKEITKLNLGERKVLITTKNVTEKCVIFNFVFTNVYI